MRSEIYTKLDIKFISAIIILTRNTKKKKKHFYQDSNTPTTSKIKIC